MALKGDIYCSRCGVKPGSKSGCVGVFSTHNFVPSTGSEYCDRCGVYPGQRTTCLSLFDSHNFIQSTLIPKPLAKTPNVTPQGNRSDIEETPQYINTEMKKISIAFISADPSDEIRLRLGSEFREINEKLKMSSSRENFLLAQPVFSARPQDLTQALLESRPNIVHFSGHGSKSGELCFENADGESHPISTNSLAALFKQFSKNVDCVVLNACYSETQAQAIAEHIKYVVGMNDSIGDEAAIKFSIGFYQALGANTSIPEAFEMGKIQIQLENIDEHNTPVLLNKTT